MANEIRNEEYYFELAKRAVPDVLSRDPKYQIILKLLAYALYRDRELISALDYAYNADLADSELLTKIADTLAIDYPLAFDEGRLRLLLKYYNKIRRNRGSLDSIKQLIRILETTEEDIALNRVAEYLDLTVEEIREGSIIIEYDGITDFEFVHSMLRTVRPAGYEVHLANKDGPVKYKYDSGVAEDTVNVKSWRAYTDSGTLSSEKVNIVKGLRKDSARVYERLTLKVDKVGKSGKDSVASSDSMTLEKS
ncbi:hypothetical protein SP15_055 [Bacillus phage SP-15]|uniref:Uncharacterized protein n=1 Tax=Bacillus phage SP-15 TaxID=1792032 RepID=A0A127AX56_9CAUD|nr:hypothetical protein SP15_055 [Bacillus phage SP-15]AMM44854.1 hypothetical protein SP15_055 [Bacillus phage SP-15]